MMKEKQTWNQTLEKRRMQISNIFLSIVLIELVTELAVFFLIKSNGLICKGATERQYLFFYVFLPSVINGVIAFECYLSQRSRKKSDSQKNNAILFAASTMCFVITFFHHAVFIAYASFTIPIMITTLFGEPKKTKLVFLTNLVLALICWIHSFLLNEEDTELFFINLIASYAVLFATYLLCQVLIAYNKETLLYLRSGYRLQESLREQVKQDSLTGLYNQSAFFSYVDTVLNTDIPQGKITSLAILDLDDFKRINDTYGHSTGNEVLTKLSEMLRTSFSQKSEFISRYGGEEFAILFRNTTQKKAAEKVEQFRLEFSKFLFSSMNNKNVTFSAGIAQTKFFRDTPEDLFDRADCALYNAKAKGKNRTIIDS